MTQIDFINDTPILYGSTIGRNGKQYIGSYKPVFNKYTNKIGYAFCSKKGRINNNMSFTVGYAYKLYQSGRLSTDPERGDEKNYL